MSQLREETGDKGTKGIHNEKEVGNGNQRDRWRDWTLKRAEVLSPSIGTLEERLGAFSGKHTILGLEGWGNSHLKGFIFFMKNYMTSSAKVRAKIWKRFEENQRSETVFVRSKLTTEDIRVARMYWWHGETASGYEFIVVLICTRGFPCHTKHR